MFDIRQDKEALTFTRAHGSTASGLALSCGVPGLLVTASEEETVKIWDIKDSSVFQLVHEKKLKLV
jgi:WD40 repeat protein